MVDGLDILAGIDTSPKLPASRKRSGGKVQLNVWVDPAFISRLDVARGGLARSTMIRKILYAVLPVGESHE